MKLKDYINEHYNGVVLQFSNDNGFKRQQVEQCIKKGFYYVIKIEDDLMLVMGKKVLVNRLESHE